MCNAHQQVGSIVGILEELDDALSADSFVHCSMMSACECRGPMPHIAVARHDVPSKMCIIPLINSKNGFSIICERDGASCV